MWGATPLIWVLSPLVLSLWVSTVYLRYHYLVDCVAGFVLVPLCLCLGDYLFQRFGTVRFSVALPRPCAGWIGLQGSGRHSTVRGELES